MSSQARETITKREYIKVPLHTKEKLCRLVLLGGKKIKDAARKLNIKYATAKTIIYHYKQVNIRKSITKSAFRVCTITQRPPIEPMNIVVRVGGYILNQ